MVRCITVEDNTDIRHITIYLLHRYTIHCIAVYTRFSCLDALFLWSIHYPAKSRLHCIRPIVSAVYHLPWFHSLISVFTLISSPTAASICGSRTSCMLRPFLNILLVRNVSFFYRQMSLSQDIGQISASILF